MEGGGDGVDARLCGTAAVNVMQGPAVRRARPMNGNRVGSFCASAWRVRAATGADARGL